VPTSSGPAAVSGADVGELTTPTGAALLREFATGFGPCPPLTPARIGYGAGTRDIGSPNVCRIIVGEAAVAPATLSTETVALLETSIDHISAEAAAFACEQLLSEGALDVWQSPALMKKGRAAFVLSVLCPHAAADAMAERVVVLTGTLGVRRTDLARYIAARTQRVVETPWGPVRVKVGPEGAAPQLRPEFDDVARIARETGRTFGDVARELTELAAEDSPDP